MFLPHSPKFLNSSATTLPLYFFLAGAFVPFLQPPSFPVPLSSLSSFHPSSFTQSLIPSPIPAQVHLLETARYILDLSFCSKQDQHRRKMKKMYNLSKRDNPWQLVIISIQWGFKRHTTCLRVNYQKYYSINFFEISWLWCM
jgi:hypothetical protein